MGRRKYEDSEILENDDLDAVLSLVIDASRKQIARGRPAEYPPTPEGLERFSEKTLQYFEFVKHTNENPDIEKPLLVDIEGWACYLGISRVTLWSYQNRGGEWEETISFFKTCITSVKKQLGLSGRIAPLLLVFDLANNSGYKNTSEFRLTDDRPQKEVKQITLEEARRQAEELMKND